MKSIVIIYNAAIEDVVMEALRGQVEKYTVFDRITGKGKNSVPHFGDNIWPATNKLLMAVVEENIVKKVKDALLPIKEDYKTEGLKLFVFPVEELI